MLNEGNIKYLQNLKQKQKQSYKLYSNLKEDKKQKSKQRTLTEYL